MDEVDWIKSIKKVVILFTKIFIGISIVFFILFISGRAIRNDWNDIIDELKIAMIIGTMPSFLLIICYICICMFEKIVNSGRTIVKKEKQYIRDLPNYCSPAISSLIHDLKIDIYKDYTATILYLCTKEYIELVKDSTGYKIIPGKKKDISALGKCEKYVFDVIINNNKFNEKDFKQEIIKEAQERKLITDKKYSNKLRILIFALSAIILLILTYNINKIIFTILFTVIGSITYAVVMVLKLKNEEYIEIIDTNYIRTKEGKNIAILLNGVKEYIKEYTLIKDKEIEHIHLLEEYIPYALVLGEADTIENFIKNNEAYRYLIYNRNLDKK